MGTSVVLITGADGYVGRLLARRLLDSTDHQLLLLVRAADWDEFEHKRDALAAQLGAYGRRLLINACDLACPDGLVGVDPTAIRTIIHAAAVTRFDTQRDLAFKVNVGGTEALLRFAERCSSLQSFELLSTLYSSGLRAGIIEEVPHDCETGFANFYEWSKHEAEMLLLKRYNHLPWRIHRLATVIADDDSGLVIQRNAFHHSLRAYHRGLLSLAPGLPQTPLYFITGSFAVDAMLAVMARGEYRRIYHVSHRNDESLTLGELISIAFDRFEQDAAFRDKRILPPLFVDLDSFRSLSEVVSGLAGKLVRQAAGGILPFAPQLYITKLISNENLIAVCANYLAPDPRRLVTNICSYLLCAQWGRGTRRAA